MAKRTDAPATDTSPPADASTAPDDAATAPATDDPTADAGADPTPPAADDQAAPVVPVEQLPAAIEAVLFSSDKAITPGKLAEALRVPAADKKTPARAVEAAIEDLNQQYEDSGRSFRIEKVAGGYRVVTLQAFAPAIAAMLGVRDAGKLSPAAMETLAIVAYRQPITRADVEAIRGVACGEVLRTLIERRLVTIAGRAEELGRPMLYGTTKQFLEAFGLASLKDLPPVADDVATQALAAGQVEAKPEASAEATTARAESSESPVETDTDADAGASDSSDGADAEPRDDDSARTLSSEAR